MLLALSFWASLLPPANSINHLMLLSAARRLCLRCVGKVAEMQDSSLQNSGFNLTEETAPQPHGCGRFQSSLDLNYYKQWANHKQQVLQENGTCDQPQTPGKAKLRWHRHHFRYNRRAFSSKLNSFTERFLTNATSEQDYLESPSSGRNSSCKLFSLKIYSVYK